MRDERGLYLRIDPSGGKYWILRYWENKDEIQLARSKGESPSRKTVQAPQLFSEIANEWLNVRMKDKAESYVTTINFALTSIYYLY